MEPFTEYMISISVFNPEGEGPSTTITATTDEGSKRLKDWKDYNSS